MLRRIAAGAALLLVALGVHADTISIRISGKIESIFDPFDAAQDYAVGDRWDVTYLVDLDTPDRLAEFPELGSYGTAGLIGRIAAYTFATPDSDTSLADNDEGRGGDQLRTQWRPSPTDIFGYNLASLEIVLRNSSNDAFDDTLLRREYFDPNRFLADESYVIAVFFAADQNSQSFNMRLTMDTYEVTSADFVGAHMEGFDALRVACRNESLGTSGSAQTQDISNVTVLDCGALGVDVRTGDDVVLQTVGFNFTRPLTGFAINMADVGVQCENNTTGEIVTGSGAEKGFDCERLGMTLRQSDIVTITQRGTATGGRPTIGKATAFGLDTRVLGCANLTTGITVTEQDIAPRLASTVDCELLGVTAADSESLRLQFTGLNFGPRLDGVALGLDPTSVVTCSNETTGQSLGARLGDDLAWDCIDLGLGVSNQDQVVVTIGGPAAP